VKNSSLNLRKRVKRFEIEKWAGAVLRFSPFFFTILTMVLTFEYIPRLVEIFPLLPFRMDLARFLMREADLL